MGQKHTVLHKRHDDQAETTYAHAKRRAYERYAVPGYQFAALHAALVRAIQHGESRPLEWPGNTKTRHWQAVTWHERLWIVLYSSTFQAICTFAHPESALIALAEATHGQPGADRAGLQTATTRA